MIQESYDWIVNCIYSCTNEFHLKCCRTLLHLFATQFKEDNEVDELLDRLLDDLRTQETTLLVGA